MVRPLVPVALVYAAGLLAGRFLPAPLTLLFAASFALVALAVTQSRFHSWLLWPMVFFVAWTNFCFRTSIVSPFDLRQICPASAQLVTVRGELLETPVERVFQRDGRETSSSSARIQVHLLRREREASFEPAFGVIQATVRGNATGRRYGGQVVEVSGVLAPPHGPVAPGLFDYGAYLRQQGIYFQLRSNPGDEWLLISGSRTAPWNDRFQDWARRTIASGLPEQDLPLRLLWAMTLGWREGLDSDAYDPFVKSGTMHIFAISGLHIALIAGILVGVLRVARVPRAWCGLVVIPLIWLYTAGTGWQPSAVRSTIMMTIVIGGWALKRPGDLVNSLAGAALIILLWDPLQLFGASFQLSFFVVLSLALFAPPLRQFQEKWFKCDPMLPDELVPRWRRLIDRPLRALTTLLTTSLAAWLGSLPLTAYYFNIVSPATLLANTLVVPLSGAALASNIGSLACGWLAPALSELFNFSGWGAMNLMVKVSLMATDVPGGWFYVKAPSLITVVLYFSVVMGALVWGLRAPTRARFWLVVCVLLAGWGAWQFSLRGAQAKLTLLPIEGGLGIYCDTPGKHGRLLIDPGNSNAVELVTSRYMRSEGINSCPLVVLTHGDAQHVGGAELILGQFGVRELVTSPLRFRSPVYRKIVDSRGRISPGLRQVSRGQALGPFQVLHPAEDDRVGRADDGALVLIGELLGTRVLLLSDLGAEGQRLLLSRGGDLQAEIVICGLPAVGEPICDALLEQVRPRLVVVADAEFPASARASPTLRSRLEQLHVPVVFTRKTGPLTLDFKPLAWRAVDSQGQVIKSGRTFLMQAAGRGGNL